MPQKGRAARCILPSRGKNSAAAATTMPSPCHNYAAISLAASPPRHYSAAPPQLRRVRCFAAEHVRAGALKYTGARHAPRALQITLKIAPCAHFVSLSSASLYSLKHFSIFSKVMYSSAWCMVLSSPASSGPNAAPCFSALA